MVPVRIRAIWNGVTYPLFRGFADSWQEPTVEDFAPDTGGPSDWTLNASDGFKVFSNYNLPTLGSAVGAGEDTGARINRILNSAGWYTGQGGGARSVETGLSDLQGTTYGDTVLNLIQIACDSEIGQLYMDGAGTTVFRNRHALLTEYRSTTVQATFGDKPTSTSGSDGYSSTYGSTYGIPATTIFPCAAIGRLDDDTTIANDIQAQIVGSTNLQEVKDSASLTKYLFPHSYQRTDLVLQTDAAALNWANWVLYISKDGESRFDTITIDPQYQPTDLWPQVLARDIGDRVAGVRNPPGVGQITREGFVAAISHTYDVFSSNWRTVWSLQDATKYGSFLTLDTAEIGELDENALAY